MLRHRQSVGRKKVFSRKLGLEPLEGRSLPSALATAMVPGDANAENVAMRDAYAAAPAALVSPVAASKGSEGKPALLSPATLTVARIDAVPSRSEIVPSRVAPIVQTDSTNQPPVITDFGAKQGLDDFWTFEGTVTDPDDSVEGMVVTFGGVLEGYNVSAVVQADGTFSITQPFPGLETGVATAQTQDPHGAQSEIAMCWVLVS